MAEGEGEDESYFPDHAVEGIDEEASGETDDKLSSLPLDLVSTSDEEEEEESGSYDEGLTGSTPPSNSRLLKMSRRGHKYKTSRKIMSSSSENQSPYRVKDITRAKSADWSESVSTPLDSSMHKRYSLTGEGEDINSESCQVLPSCDKKKKKDKSRQMERNVKSAINHPEMSTSPSSTANYTNTAPPRPSFSTPSPSLPPYPVLAHSYSSPPPSSHPPSSHPPPSHVPSSPLLSSHLPSHPPPSHPPSSPPPPSPPPSLLPPSHPPSSHSPSSFNVGSPSSYPLPPPNQSPSIDTSLYPPPIDPHYLPTGDSPILYPLPHLSSETYSSKLSSSPYSSESGKAGFPNRILSPGIPSHMQPSFSYTTDNIAPYYSLSSLSHALPVSIERSQSDAQLSLTLSSSHSMHCPPDRKQFYRSFAKRLKMIAKRQQQSSTQPGHIPRQHSEDLNAKNPWAPDNEQLRMELRAYLNNHTLEDQEEADYQLQCESGSILYRIIHYCFSFDSTLDGYFRGLSESAKSLPAQLNELRRGSMRRRKMVPLQETKEEEDEEEEEGDETPMTSINNPSVRWEDGGETEGEDEYGPQTLTQQESSDSDTSSVEFSFDNFLSQDQLEAIDDVDLLLFDLERVELLYASSQRVVDKQYRQLPFKRRRAALVLWLKITEGLAKHLVNLSKWFGVIVNPVRRSEDDSLPCNVDPGTPSRQGSDSSGGNPPLPPPPLFDSEALIDPEESLSLSALSFASSLFQTQNSLSSSRGTLQRLFSSRNILSIDEERVSSKGYSRFVDQVLKRKSLDWLIEKIIKSIKPILKTAKEAMKQLDIEEDKTEEDSDSEDNSSSPEKPSPLHLLHFGGGGTAGASLIKRASSVAPKCWMDEFQDMNLPSFAEQVSHFINVHVCMLSTLHFSLFCSIFV